MAPTPGVMSDPDESLFDISGPSSYNMDNSFDSNLNPRFSSRNTSTSGPTAPSSAPVQTPSPSSSFVARLGSRRDISVRSGDTPIRPPAKLNTRGISDDDVNVTVLAPTPLKPSRALTGTDTDTPTATKKADKRSHAIMTLREHEKVKYHFPLAFVHDGCQKF